MWDFLSNIVKAVGSIWAKCANVEAPRSADETSNAAAARAGTEAGAAATLAGRNPRKSK